MFSRDVRQPEVDFLHSWAVVKILKSTNLVIEQVYLTASFKKCY